MHRASASLIIERLNRPEPAKRFLNKIRGDVETQGCADREGSRAPAIKLLSWNLCFTTQTVGMQPMWACFPPLWCRESSMGISIAGRVACYELSIAFSYNLRLSSGLLIRSIPFRVT
jgi:hypothetical protein